jgi:uncharacterized protein
MKSQTLHRATATSRATRSGYLLLGLLCVGLGFIGYIVPGMPGTVFFIVALWAFQRSSPRLEQWLLNNRYVGPTLQDWRANKSMRPRTKVVAITAIWLCMALTVFLTQKLWLAIVLGITATALTYYLATRPSSPKL